MFRFIREKILPLFLASGLRTHQFAKVANVSDRSVLKAVTGAKIPASVVGKIGKALGLTNAELINYLEV